MGPPAMALFPESSRRGMSGTHRAELMPQLVGAFVRVESNREPRPVVHRVRHAPGERFDDEVVGRCRVRPGEFALAAVVVEHSGTVTQVRYKPR